MYTHCYTGRRFVEGGEMYKALCTGDYVLAVNYERRAFGMKGRQLDFFTAGAGHKITCPKCLRLLLPRYEDRLNQMRDNLAKAEKEKAPEAGV